MRTILKRGARRGGFTLVEMLLVLVILAALAAIVIPKMTGRSKEARVTAVKSQIASFSTALDAFEIDNGFFPKGADGLNDLVTQPADAKKWTQYLKNVPKDPWGNAYIYEAPGKHNANGYDISSMGEDGRAGTEDDLTNWTTE